MQISLLVQMLKEKIESKLIDRPFLRFVVLDRWCQLGFLAVVLALISAGLYLPKIWRVSPPGFEPVIHISGLDMTQNWALKRSARKLQEAGDFVKAGESWRGATSENPVDVSAVRGYIENSLHIQRRDNRPNATLISHMPWLLRINQTNTADLDLIARVCDHYEWYDVVAYVLGPLQKQGLPEAAEAVMIKSLLHQGRMAEFADRLQKNGAQLKDPELGLYRLAYQAGWGDAGSDEALAQLEKSAQGGENAERAGHLVLRAAAQKNKINAYSQELERLAARDEATTADHAWYWALLAANGRTNEAVKLAQSASLTPNSASELIRLAQSYMALGLVENAEELLKRQTPQFGRAPEVWVAYGGVLEKRQNWDEMRAVARLIREDPALRQTTWGLSYFFEGRADLAQKREAGAETAFKRAAESPFDLEYIGMMVGRELTHLNYPKLALQVYQTIEPKFEKSLEYWNDVFAASYAAQDTTAMLKATEHSYQLNPKDPLALNRFAAALLLNRVRSDEAIQLTLQLYSKYPQSSSAAINHSCALLLNNRAAEAKTLLESLDVQKLNSVEISPYYLSLFEAYHALKMWDRAWKARESITESALFPIQREWLHAKEKEMPKRLAETL